MSDLIIGLILGGAMGGLTAGYLPKPGWKAFWEWLKELFRDDDDDLPRGGRLAGLPL